jgi:hypothetical protein
VPPPPGFDYPRDFDDLGRSEDDFSYMAVVHADGNGLGKRFADLAKRYGDNDLTYRAQVRALSAAIDAAACLALGETLDALKETINRQKGTILHKPATKEITTIRLKQARPAGREADPEDENAAADGMAGVSATGDGAGAGNVNSAGGDGSAGSTGEEPGNVPDWYLPFRPIVFGGDDVTFVCDGRLGPALAVEYLERFRVATGALPDGAGAADACAGVAIVKTHYPFARAYGLAADLCSEAKGARHVANLAKPAGTKSTGSWLDWHFALSGLAGDIKEIRRREYTGRAGTAGNLTLRPVTLDDAPESALRRWEVVEKGARAFQGDQWAERHNKVKALREALRDGPGAVGWFLTKFNERNGLPIVAPAYASVSKTGWEDRCVYFDAVELADWYVPLREELAEKRPAIPAPASTAAAGGQA